MTVIDRVHESVVYSRRAAVLSDQLAALIPSGSHLLDVGCGDGLITKTVGYRASAASVEGVEVLARPNARIPVRPFDGRRLPYSDNSFDVVMFVDVIHHATDGLGLLREAARVSKDLVVVKDHLRSGFLAGPTLAFMDRVGNARHGVASPGHYWTESQWRDGFEAIEFDEVFWTTRVPLYPWWASWVFGRSLHFIAAFRKRSAAAPRSSEPYR